MRHNEDKLNAILSTNVRWPADPQALGDPHTKASLLLQAHMSRLALPISDYVGDTKSVLDNSLRILQAMVDISADSGWLGTTLIVMNLIQSIMQAGPVTTEIIWDLDLGQWLLHRIRAVI